MKPVKTAQNAAKVGWDTFEEFGKQTVAPISSEVLRQFGFNALSARPKELAGEDLKHAREEKKLEEMKREEDKKQKERLAFVREEYKAAEQTVAKEQRELKQEVVELQGEVVKLAQAAGVETKVHMEQMPKKVGVLDIKRLTAIVRLLRIKAESAQSGSELVNQRQNAKRATGMMAWVSGKQMKIHEQGTLQLQG